MKTEIESIFGSDCSFDPFDLEVYSSDASIYRIQPLAIVFPRNSDQLLALTELALEKNIPLIPRGAATGITGGCLGAGIVIDCSRHMNKILEINTEERWAWVEPGVVQDQLNQALVPYGLRLGPDTSTGNRATLGGMVANNSSGARSLFYGNTQDHLLELELITGKGQKITLSEQGPPELYEEVDNFAKAHREALKTLPHLPKKSSGYLLDDLNKDSPFHLAKLIAGSEGSLGIVSKIKIGLSLLPKCSGLVLMPYSSFNIGLSRLELILDSKPSSLELLDQEVLNLGKLSKSMQGKTQWLDKYFEEVPGMLFIAEAFADDPVDLEKKLYALERNSGSLKPVIVQDPAEIEAIWTVRKAGLGLLLSRRVHSKAIAFIEDLSVPPKQLASFIDQLLTLFDKHELKAGLYGHAGSGCLHARPFLNLRDPLQVEKMETLMNEVCDLVKEHEGVLSAEHGDGLIRSWLNPKLFGEELQKAFEAFKAIFDPKNVMNPGKVVHPHPLKEQLKVDPKTALENINTALDFTQEGGFSFSIEMCNGNGLCRKKEGLMCPSYQATLDEKHSTRGRAAALSAIAQGRSPPQALQDPSLMKILDLCLECRGCKTQCPSQVDMSKLKSEVLAQSHLQGKTPFRSILFAHLDKLLFWGQKMASISNTLSQNPIFKKLQPLLGISKERSLPLFAETRFLDSYVHTPTHLPKAVLFVDSYTQYLHPEIGHAAAFVLENAGYEVICPQYHCCGRSYYSKGLIKQAHNYGQEVLDILHPFMVQNLPIIILEPSCFSMIKEDYLNLHLGPKAKQLSKEAHNLESFFKTHPQALETLASKIQANAKEVKLHTHCHQASYEGNSETLELLRSLGFSPQSFPEGCCGMAGAFGYEKEHYELSMKIAELKLAPALKTCDSETPLISSGFSCRCQIQHLSSQRPQHLAEIIASEIGPHTQISQEAPS